MVEGDERHVVRHARAGGPRATVRASMPPSASSVTDSALISTSDPRPAAQEREDLGEGRDPLARVGARRSGPGSPPTPRGPRPASAGARRRGRSVVRSSVGSWMTTTWPSRGELHVELDERGPDLERAREGGEGVLGPVRGVAPVGDDEGRRGHAQALGRSSALKARQLVDLRLEEDAAAGPGRASRAAPRRCRMSSARSTDTAFL